jgi:hypothetical protein
MNVSDVSISGPAGANGLPTVTVNGFIIAGILPTLGGILHVGDWSSIIVTLFSSGAPVRWWVDWSDDPNMLYEHKNFGLYSTERNGIFHLWNIEQLGAVIGTSILLPVRAPFMKITLNGSNAGAATVSYSVRGTMEGARAARALPNPSNGTGNDSSSLIIPSTDATGSGVTVGAAGSVEHILKPYFGRAHFWWNLPGSNAGTNISINSKDQNGTIRSTIEFIQKGSDISNGRIDLNLPGDCNTILYRNGEAGAINILAAIVPEQS